MINFFSVLVAAIAAFMVGWVWYGPLFGKFWQKASGWSEQELAESKHKGMGGTMVQAFIAVLIMSYVLAYLLNLLSVSGVGVGLTVAFWLWLGFIAVPSYMNKLFGKNKSMTLFLIDSVHYLAALLVASVVLTLWR